MNQPARGKQIMSGASASRIAMRAPEVAERGPARQRASMEREIRRLERRCEALREDARVTELAQADLLSMVSHDLRNPLSVILVSTRMLSRALTSEQAGKRHVDAIGRAAEEINQMLQDFSDAARLDSGRLVVGRERHEVAAIVEQALHAVRPFAEAKPVHLASQLAPDVGTVVGDRERLAKVLSALVGNAIKFTPKGGSITIHVEPDDEGLRFSVHDTGPGIADEHRPLLFSRPSTAPGTRRAVTQGSGLALFVAKGVVEAHGGQIGAENREGGGSTFHFTLPDIEPDELAPIN